MALETKDFLNTDPIQAPAAQTGVMNQLRYWGMGKSANKQGTPQLQNNMSMYKLNAEAKHASVQNRAAMLQIGAEHAQTKLQAEAAKDQSQMNWEGLEQQEGDMLDAFGRTVAGVGLIGRGVTNALGKAGDALEGKEGNMGAFGKDLQNAAEFMKTLPMFSDPAESAELDKAMEENERLTKLSKMNSVNYSMASKSREYLQRQEKYKADGLSPTSLTVMADSAVHKASMFVYNAHLKFFSQ